VKRWIIIGAFVLATSFGVLVFTQLDLSSACWTSILPNPNGYDDFLRAARLRVSWKENLGEMSTDQLRAIVQQNSRALEEVRQGLKKQSAVPVTNDLNWINGRMGDLASFKSMAQLLAAEGMIALDEKRTNDAVRCFTECITFGHAVNRRGLMIHDMVASACQEIGAQRLAAVVEGVPNDVRRETIASLLAVDALREPAATVLQSDREWARGAYGPWKTTWAQLMTRKSIRTIETRFITQHNRSVTALRVTIIDLALRGYMAENGGKPPQKLDDLVPKWLPAVPIDSVINKPFIYQPGSNSFSLSGGAPEFKIKRGDSSEQSR
jgi:hypothetical protein